MASVIYNSAKKGFADGTLDWDTHTIKAALLMTNTTADTQNDGIVHLSDLTTLDECNSTGYARISLAGKAVNTDDGNDRAELDANDISFASLGGNASRDIQGVLIYKHVDGTAANDIVIAFIDFAADIGLGASQIDIPWNAEGIIQLA